MKKTGQCYAMIFMAACALLLAGCANPAGSDSGGGAGAGIPQAARGLRLYFGGQPSGRTVLPDPPVFTRYEVTLTALEGQQHGGGVSSFTSGTGFFPDLDYGLWLVEVSAYTDLGGHLAAETQAAAGLKEIRYRSLYAEEAITIRSSMGGTPGVFAWDIDLSGLTLANQPGLTASLDLYTRDSGGDWTVPAMSVTLNAGSAAAGYESTLVPGYYLMRLNLANAYQDRSRAEIVQIYSALESRYAEIIDDSWFVPLKQITGTVPGIYGALCNPGTDPMELRIFLDNGNIFASYDLSPSGDDGLLSAWIPRSFTGTVLLKAYNKVSDDYHDLGSAEITGEDDVDLGSPGIIP